MLLSGSTIPVHAPTWTSVAPDFQIPGSLGYGIALPISDATWTLPHTIVQVTGAPLYIKNVSDFTITLITIDETAIVGPNTIGPQSTGSFVFDGMAWQTVLVTLTQGSATTGITTIVSAGGSPPYSAVVSGLGPAAQLVNFTTGGGIAITPTNGGSTLSFSNTDPGSAVTLSSAGGTQPLVADGTGPSLSIQGITYGSGVQGSSNGSAVTLTGTGVTGNGSVTDITTDTDQSLTAAQMGPMGVVNFVGPWTNNRTTTLPTVAALLTAFPFLNTGDQYMVLCTNASGFTNAWNTSAAGWTTKRSSSLYTGANAWMIVQITSLSAGGAANVWTASSPAPVAPLNSTVFLSQVSGAPPSLIARPVGAGGPTLTAVFPWTSDSALVATAASMAPGNFFNLTGPWSVNHQFTLPSVASMFTAIPGLAVGDFYTLFLFNSSGHSMTWGSVVGWTFLATITISTGNGADLFIEITSGTTANIWTF